MIKVNPKVKVNLTKENNGKEPINKNKIKITLSIIRSCIKKLFKFIGYTTLLTIVFILIINFLSDYIGTTDADYDKVAVFRAHLTSINTTDPKILYQQEHLINLIDTSLADGKLTISEASSIEIRYALFKNNYPNIFKE